MMVREFIRGTAGWLNRTVETGEPLHIENYHRPHATVVPTSLWQEAEAALRREQAREAAGEASMT